MGTRWAAVIQRAVDDVAHVGPELETAGGAFRLMAKQAGARGRATDAAMPGREGRAERRRGRVGGKPFDRVCLDRGHVFSPGNLRRLAVGGGFERHIVVRDEDGSRKVVRFDDHDPVSMREWMTKEGLDSAESDANALGVCRSNPWGSPG